MSRGFVVIISCGRAATLAGGNCSFSSCQCNVVKCVVFRWGREALAARVSSLAVGVWGAVNAERIVGIFGTDRKTRN